MTTVRIPLPVLVFVLVQLGQRHHERGGRADATGLPPHEGGPASVAIVGAILANPHATPATIGRRYGVDPGYVRTAQLMAERLPWLAQRVAAGAYPLAEAVRLGKAQSRGQRITRRTAARRLPPGWQPYRGSGGQPRARADAAA